MRALIADFREMLSEQFEYRELLLQMTKRDLLLRYKQTAMGFAWAVFMPLVNTVVFSVIFTRVASIDTPVPYPVFAYCGLWVWNFFASSLRFAVNSLTSNTNMVTKVYFPREIFPFSAVFVCFVDFLVGSAVLMGLMAWYSVPIGLHILWLPAVMAALIVFTMSLALFVAVANLFYRDVKYLFEVVITVWMFASSVIYPTTGVSGTLGTALALNPMTTLIDSFRSVILLNQPPPSLLAVVGPAAIIGLLACWLFFHRAEFQFAENI